MKNKIETVVANTEKAFTMPVKASEFLVLNNTAGDLHVCIGNTYDSTKSALVPAKCSRIISNGGFTDTTENLIVLPTESGEVEIECTKF